MLKSNPSPPDSGTRQKVLAGVAMLFGVVTIFAGTRVLTGTDPGYIVFRPLLVYNTVMGFFYVAAGIMAWRNLEQGRKAAAAIFLLNLLVLVAIGFLYRSGGAVAIESLRAMTLRTGIWLVLFVSFRRLGHRSGTSRG